MQPTFPSDHHSHEFRRRNGFDGVRDRRGRLWSEADISAAAESGAAYLSRHVLPALDSTDPRGAG